MATAKTSFAYIICSALLTVCSVPVVNAAAFSTDVSISGTSPFYSSSHGNYGWLTSWTGGYSGSGMTYDYYLNNSFNSVSAGATGIDPTSTNQASLANGAGLFLQNTEVVGSGPWSSYFASVSMKSGIFESFYIGSYTAPAGALINGVLKVDLGLSYSVASNTVPTVGSGMFGPYLRFGPGIDLFVGSSISAKLQSWDQTETNEFTGSTWLNASDLANSVSASTLLEIPFSTTVGSTLLLDTQLVTNFLAAWSPAFVFQEMISLSSFDPIVLDLQTPDAYYKPTNSGYFGPDQFVAKVDEPGGLFLVLIGLSLLILRRRLYH